MSETESIEGTTAATDTGGRTSLRERVAFLKEDRLGFAGVIVLTFVVVVAVFAPVIAPYDPAATDYYASFEPPSAAHPFGTDNAGRDIFSQLVYGARPAVQVGLFSAAAVALIGMNVGLVAGYYGGLIDDALMRLVDFAYGIPFTPFVIVLVGLWEPSLWTIVLAITLLLWRQTARVVRSAVLNLKEKPFVKSARTAGASDRRIIYRHIAPNVLPLTFLYGSFAIAWAILTEASISFLGFGDPDATTWGQMLQAALQSQALARDAWWWFTMPGLAIMATVISAFLIGRGYEEQLNPQLKE
ncbi:MAG: ABC transporter permease [Halobaculum sp.]|jgi:peptide/nickel transport system permease protein